MVRVTDARDRVDATYSTARTDLRKLKRAGIIQPLKGAPRLTHFSAPILASSYRD